MAHSKLIIRTVFGIIGNVISSGLFASQMPTFYKIIKNKPVEEVKPEYYLLSTLNCLFWVLYAMPFIHPGSILVLTANGIGLVIHLVYLIIFLLYAKDHKQRRYVGGAFLIELVLVGLVSVLVIGLAQTVLYRTAVVGGFSITFALLMLMSRAFLTVDVCKTKSVESMSFLLALSNTLNDLCWLIYASLRFDFFLSTPYLEGFCLGVVQLILYGVYYKSIRISGDDKKLASTGAQLQQIFVGYFNNLDTSKVQIQEIDTGDTEKLATAPVQLQVIVTV